MAGSIWLAIAFTLVTTRTSLAEEDWKDGCPAKFPPEMAPKYMANPPMHDGSAAFGALPEPDSPLGGSRIALIGDGTWVANRVGPDVPPTKLLTGEALAQISWKSGPMVMADWAYGDALGDSGYTDLGNIELFVGYRHTGYLLGPGFRQGTAIRLGGGGSLFTEKQDAVSEEDKRLRMSALSPFQERLFAVERPFGVTLEQRVEMTGCHSPFIDLRLDLGVWQPGDNGPHIIAMPIELSGGAYLSPSFTTFVALGLDLHSRALGYGNVFRTKVGFDCHPLYDHGFRLGIHLSAITGNDVTGLSAMVVLSVQLKPTPTGSLE